MPVKELTEFFHERDVMVLVDGAHAAGQIKDLNVEDYKADFYTGESETLYYMYSQNENVYRCLCVCF